MAKFLFAIGSLFIAVIIDNLYINLFIFFIMVFLTTIVAGIPIKSYFKLYLIPGLFLLISILTILISISDVDIFIYSIKIRHKYFGINEVSLNLVVHTIFRVLASISSTYFMALTTPINQLIIIFQRLKLPNTMVELIVLIYRFIFIFLEESKEIYTAQEMRFGYTNIKNSYRSTSMLIKCLFVRVLFRYKDMSISLDTKLYNGEFKIGG